MCNRYSLVDPDSAFAEIARILGIPLNKPQWVTQRYNIGLMQVAAAFPTSGFHTTTVLDQYGCLEGGPWPTMFD